MASVPQSPFGGALKFKRPTARGRASTNNLRQGAVNDENSDSTRDVFHSAEMKLRDNDIDMTGSYDTETDAGKTVSSRTASPAHTPLMARNMPLGNVPREPSSLAAASASLARLMDDAHSGSFAVGALGQKLLDQQAQMNTLMERLETEQQFESADASSSASHKLIEQTQARITEMKEEQQKLVADLLQASNIDLTVLLADAARNIESQTFVTSLGDQMSGASTSSNAGSNSAARDLRRQKNAAAPNLNKDETLINDIQQQLIHEIRRLQALVAERDKALAAMSEALDEAARIKALHEASIKKLEMEKDTQDANLYELEAKEAILREEHEGVAKQLKKLENDMRILRRQLAEKADAAESFKASNEELEEKLEDAKGNVATLKAKGVADQKTITGLKSQVNDYEVKARQAFEKIPASSSWAHSLGHDNVGDASMASTESRDAPNTPGGNGRAGSHAHAQALSPSASVDEALASRLRPNETIKSLEADVAKWKAAAFKYRKKWGDTRRQGGQMQTPQEHDDSTDEEDEKMWTDEPAPVSRKMSARSRLVSVGSRKGKSMGDAFGLRDKLASWQTPESDSFETERHVNDDDDDSLASSSVRGSVDGFDPSFADPTLRGGRPVKRSKRWSAISAGGMTSSPLSRQLHMGEDNDGSVQDESFASTGNRSVVHPGGALGDELGELQGGNDHMEQDAGITAAELEAAIAQRDAEHATHISTLKTEHAEEIARKEAEHHQITAHLESKHAQALQNKDNMLEESLAALQKHHADNMSEQAAGQSGAIEAMKQRHASILNSREADHDRHISELEGQLKSTADAKLAKQGAVHEELMTEARQRHADALARQRAETEAALVAAQREYKKTLEERDAMHATALAVKESEYGRNLSHKQREHEQAITKLKEGVEAELQQQEAAFLKLIAYKDAKIRSQEEDLARLRERLAALERDLTAARQTAQTAESDLKGTSEKLAVLQAFTESMPKSDSQHSSESFKEARETAATSVRGPDVEMRESASQTDALSGDVTMSEVHAHALASPPAEERTTDDTWLAKSSTIQRNRPSNEATSEVCMMPSKSSEITSVRASEMPPPELPRLSKVSPPSRPTSPPPSDLLVRARAGNSIDLQRSGSGRSSGPPPSSYVPPHKSHDSTASRRESISSKLGRAHVRGPSALSMRSDTGTDFLSGRSDVTSAFDEEERQHQILSAKRSQNAAPTTTDPAILGAVTSTMIGTYMYKYTRRGMGRTNKRHRRYFWVHPYTRTLYWTETAPSEAVSSEAINKSAFIQDVMVVDDDNIEPLGLHHASIIVQSLSRDVKFTATSKAQHDMWITALGYLVNRELPSEAAPNRSEPSDWRQSMRGKSLTMRTPSRLSLAPRKSSTAERAQVSPRRSLASLKTRVRARASDANLMDAELTPRARGNSVSAQSPSLLHRRDTAAREYMEHWELLNNSNATEDATTPRAGAVSSMSHRSTRSSRPMPREAATSTPVPSMLRKSTAKLAQRDPRAMTAEEMLAEDEAKAGYEGLDNVRACCNGKHDVGSLAGRHHHHHQHSSRESGVKPRKSQSKLSLTLGGSDRPGTSTRLSNYSSLLDANDDVRSSSRASTRRTRGDSHLTPLDANKLVAPANGMTEAGTVKADLSKLATQVHSAQDGENAGRPAKRSASSTHAEGREFGSLGRGSTAPSALVSEEAERARAAASTPLADAAGNQSGRTSALGRRIEKVMQIRRSRQSTSIR